MSARKTSDSEYIAALQERIMKSAYPKTRREFHKGLFDGFLKESFDPKAFENAVNKIKSVEKVVDD